MNSLDPDQMQRGDNCIYLSFICKMGSHAFKGPFHTFGSLCAKHIALFMKQNILPFDSMKLTITELQQALNSSNLTKPDLQLFRQVSFRL